MVTPWRPFLAVQLAIIAWEAAAQVMARVRRARGKRKVT